MKRILMLGFCFFFAIGLARSGDYQTEIDAVLAREATASSFEEVKKAADELGKISQAYPEEWTAAYWAAFVYSQCWVFGQSSENGYFLDLAQAYYQRANTVYAKRSSGDEAEYQALYSLINGLKAYYHRQESHHVTANLFREISNQALEKAAKADANNPRVKMLQSINTFNKPETREKGIEQMKAALKSYENHKLPISYAPNWGKSFLDYRLNKIK